MFLNGDLMRIGSITDLFSEWLSSSSTPFCRNSAIYLKETIANISCPSMPFVRLSSAMSLHQQILHTVKIWHIHIATCVHSGWWVTLFRSKSWCIQLCFTIMERQGQMRSSQIHKACSDGICYCTQSLMLIQRGASHTSMHHSFICHSQHSLFQRSSRKTKDQGCTSLSANFITA